MRAALRVSCSLLGSMSDYVVYILFRIRNRITGVCASSGWKAYGKLNATITHVTLGAMKYECVEVDVLSIAPLQSEIFNDSSSLIAEIGILPYAFV